MAAGSRTVTRGTGLVLLAGTLTVLAPTAMAGPTVAVAQPVFAVAAPGLVAAPVIDASMVVALDDPGVELTAPVDGRLRGDGVALVVTGAALTNEAGQGGQTVKAGPGDRLIVFGLRLVPQPDSAGAAPPALALIVDGQRRLVNLASLPAAAPGYFAAAIPATATDVTLELSAAAFTQDFDLLTLTRVGPDPACCTRTSTTLWSPPRLTRR